MQTETQRAPTTSRHTRISPSLARTKEDSRYGHGGGKAGNFWEREKRKEKGIEKEEEEGMYRALKERSLHTGTRKLDKFGEGRRSCWKSRRKRRKSAKRRKRSPKKAREKKL
ncbi:hypothetical protein E2C01_091598 [Portunus trituberculatus]|uniref:Uncharacterized protein n=1 Tax=Portunus trituberculatus TaxID=210409 RepID=A0A5B7JJF8_PORTR|nr:hypothetical protein [Portunus trituberculatus]